MKQKYKAALLDMAERFGETSYATRLKVGALLFKNDSIIALGTNGQPPKWSYHANTWHGWHLLVIHVNKLLGSWNS